jgi:hypothetical protein
VILLRLILRLHRPIAIPSGRLLRSQRQCLSPAGTRGFQRTGDHSGHQRLVPRRELANLICRARRLGQDRLILQVPRILVRGFPHTICPSSSIVSGAPIKARSRDPGGTGLGWRSLAKLQNAITQS